MFQTVHTGPTPYARRIEPVTSHEAALIIQDHLTKIQRNVLTFARKRGQVGFMLIELENYFDDHGSTYRTRCSALVRAGKIINTGQCDRCPGDKRRRTVWAIAPKKR